MMPVLVRLSFLKLMNLNFQNKLVHKEFYLKKSEKKFSGFSIYHRKLFQLMKITEQETLHYFTGNT